MFKKTILLITFMFTLSACSTSVAVVDTVASTTIYTAKAVVKTTVNVIDAVTPDIINKE
jgi:starvation-inducible outer membrane lipoprotein